MAEEERETPRGGLVSDLSLEEVNDPDTMDDFGIHVGSWTFRQDYSPRDPYPWNINESLESVDDSDYLTVESFSSDMDIFPDYYIRESTAPDDLHSRDVPGSNTNADNSLRAAAQPVVIVGDAARGVNRPVYTPPRDGNLRSRSFLSPGNPPTGVRALIPTSHGGPSISREDLDRPEFRMLRLIESTNRHRVLRSDSEADNLRNNILQSQISLEASRKRKHDGEDDQKEEKSDDASNFECNICFDMAKGPVVTPCGHLFCWQCLYRWLHVNSLNSECPVCKGEVLEVNVTPIYGRGSTGNNKCEEGESDNKIPPRPHANRIESTRQQHHTAPLQAFEGIVEIRHVILDREVPNGERNLPHRSSNLRRRLSSTQLSSGVRLRARRTQRDVGSGSNLEAVVMPSEYTSDHQLPVVVRRGNHDALLPTSTTGLLAEPSHYIRHRIESRFNMNHSSDSSTRTVIQDDHLSHSELQGTSTDDSTVASRRPSTSSRRRGRTAITDSVLDSGEVNQSRRRRV